jgi:single-strand DNA-binding protein
MSGINKVIIVGNLGKDPKINHTKSGDVIASFSIATSDTWKDKATGEKKERTEWHNIVVFNEALAKLAENYLKKGSKVYIEGALQTRKYEKDGIERYTTEVVLQKYKGEIALLDRQESNRPPAASSPDDYGSADHTLDDDVPF